MVWSQVSFWPVSPVVEMPLHEAGIAMFSALYGHDFRSENDLLPALGLDGLSISAAARSGARLIGVSRLRHPGARLIHVERDRL